MYRVSNQPEAALSLRDTPYSPAQHVHGGDLLLLSRLLVLPELVDGFGIGGVGVGWWTGGAVLINHYESLSLLMNIYSGIPLAVIITPQDILGSRRWTSVGG